jgi:hypothetical protein
MLVQEEAQSPSAPGAGAGSGAACSADYATLGVTKKGASEAKAGFVYTARGPACRSSEIGRSQ